MIQLPQLWLDEIAAGTDFGKRVAKALSTKAIKPSTIGVHILNALESANVYVTSTGDCRRFIQSLNRPHKLTADEITDRLVMELSTRINTWSDPVVPAPREWLAEIVATAIQADAESRPAKPDTVPPVSDVGTRIITAIESAGDYRITCGTCKTRIRTFNNSRAIDLDPDTVTDFILSDFQESPKIREEVGGTEEQRIWLRAIVAGVIESTGPS